MRKKFYLAAFLAPIAALALSSCIKDPEWGRTLEASQLEEADARAFFERYVEGLPMELRPAGITPGNFAPEWAKATPASSGGVAYLNVPIVAEHAYEGYFAKDYTQTPKDDKDYYHTAIAQKLAVAKEQGTGRFACVVVTIIPAESHATKSSSEVQRMFYCGGANARFSGVVIYSTFEDGGYTLCVDRYQKGEIVARRDVYNADNAKEMAALVGSAKIAKKAAVRTKTEKAGGLFGVNELDEVVVTAPAGGGTGGGDGYLWYIPADGVDSGGSSGGNGSNGGGGGGGGGGGNLGNTGSNVAPNAKKLFESADLTTAQWTKIENMINKIRVDCIGGKLYNMVDSKLGSNTIDIIPLRGIEDDIRFSIFSKGGKLELFNFLHLQGKRRTS
ncbi:MAG: hypothetical protein LBF67_09330 [Prevotellaceae bacterium]|jgi:uncharacterized membrane protein YgcG|nr:hypothetical protein [Prevotellaceae bacterium]